MKKKGNLVLFVDNNIEDENNTIEDNEIARTGTVTKDESGVVS